MSLKKMDVKISDSGGALQFNTPESFLGDAMIYTNRCAQSTGEMHLIFRDADDGYHCQHICQPAQPDWTLIYASNPYQTN